MPNKIRRFAVIDGVKTEINSRTISILHDDKEIPMPIVERILSGVERVARLRSNSQTQPPKILSEKHHDEKGVEEETLLLCARPAVEANKKSYLVKSAVEALNHKIARECKGKGEEQQILLKSSSGKGDVTVNGITRMKIYSSCSTPETGFKQQNGAINANVGISCNTADSLNKQSMTYEGTKIPTPSMQKLEEEIKLRHMKELLRIKYEQEILRLNEETKGLKAINTSIFNMIVHNNRLWALLNEQELRHPEPMKELQARHEQSLSQLALWAPIVESAAAIRLRFLEQTRKSFAYSQIYGQQPIMNRSYIQAGNDAAHEGNFIVDRAMLLSGLVPDDLKDVVIKLYDIPSLDGIFCPVLHEWRVEIANAKASVLGRRIEEGRVGSDKDCKYVKWAVKQVLGDAKTIVEIHNACVPDGDKFINSVEVNEAVARSRVLWKRIMIKLPRHG